VAVSGLAVRVLSGNHTAQEEDIMPSSRTNGSRKTNGQVSFTAPGISTEDADKVTSLLQNRLNSLTDLMLTLKHIHWNVVGPHFIAVHTMLDPQVDAVREMVDTTAERIATLGASPVGTPGALVKERSWDDYSIGRADAMEHLGALDLAYDGVITNHRDAMDQLEELDLVSQDMLIQQLAQLEQFQWFVRAHLESASGTLATQGATTERQAAAAGAKASRSS
jgi:starvation-inducible DNA-binding protein